MHRTLSIAGAFALLFAAARVAGAQPAPAARPAVPVAAAADSPFVAFYTATRAGADATQLLTLRLRADGRASLRTETPGYTQTAAGTAVTPTFETGTWSQLDGHALVHFERISGIVDRIPTDIQSESVDLSFALSGCALRLDGDPAKAYGSGGITFTRTGCAP